MKAVYWGVLLAIVTPTLVFSAPRDLTTQNSSFRPRYDASKEVTVSGTVYSLSSQGKPGLPSGAHLMISTSRGLIDAHLGGFALMGSQPVSVHPGEQVSVVGVMTMAKGSVLLLARTVQANSKTFVIRNEHGALLFPRPAAPGQVRFRMVHRGDGQQ